MCGRNDQLGKRGGPLATRDERRARGLDGRGGKQGPIVADAPEDLLDPQLLSKPDERWLALPRLAEKHLDVDGQTIGDLLDDILLGHVPESDLEQGDLREHEAKDILVTFADAPEPEDAEVAGLGLSVETPEVVEVTLITMCSQLLITEYRNQQVGEVRSVRID
ncbi:unnamed protein product [Tilletia caries]|nr:unnamed protein product [Tilletia caries]